MTSCLSASSIHSFASLNVKKKRDKNIVMSKLPKSTLTNRILKFVSPTHSFDLDRFQVSANGRAHDENLDRVPKPLLKQSGVYRSRWHLEHCKPV